MILPGETEALCRDSTMPRDSPGGLIETMTRSAGTHFSRFIHASSDRKTQMP